MVRLLCVEVFNVCVWTETRRKSKWDTIFFFEKRILYFVGEYDCWTFSCWTIKIRYEQQCCFNELNDAKKETDEHWNERKIKKILHEKKNSENVTHSMKVFKCVQRTLVIIIPNEVKFHLKKQHELTRSKMYWWEKMHDVGKNQWKINKILRSSTNKYQKFAITFSKWINRLHSFKIYSKCTHFKRWHHHESLFFFDSIK